MNSLGAFTVGQERAGRPETGLLGEYNPIVYGVTPSRVYRPGKQEWVVASTYVKELLSGRSLHGVYGRCAKALIDLGFKERSSLTCRRWLGREHIEAWIGEELKLHCIASYWTKERWLLKMTEHLEGRKRLANGDLYGMSLMSKVMGWDVPEGMGSITQINFTERA